MRKTTSDKYRERNIVVDAHIKAIERDIEQIMATVGRTKELAKKGALK